MGAGAAPAGGRAPARELSRRAAELLRGCCPGGRPSSCAGCPGGRPSSCAGAVPAGGRAPARELSWRSAEHGRRRCPGGRPNTGAGAVPAVGRAWAQALPRPGRPSSCAGAVAPLDISPGPRSARPFQSGIWIERCVWRLRRAYPPMGIYIIEHKHIVILRDVGRFSFSSVPSPGGTRQCAHIRTEYRFIIHY